MAIYKYVSFSNLKYLLDGTIRFTQPKAFNDPFELLPEIFLTDVINGFSIDVTAPKRSSEPAKLKDSFESEHCNDIVARDVLNILNDLIGILCLSRNPSSLLMWSHYADEYKGAVVEFDENHDFFTGLFPVCYESNRPKIDFNLLEDESGHIRLSELCYKPKEWEYENEFRIARNLSDCKKNGHFNGFDVHVMDVPLECIKRITMGERMPLENQRYVFGKTYNTNISLALAAVSNWGYTFRSEPIKFDRPISELSPMISPRTAHLFKDLNSEFGEMARWMIANHPMSELVNKTL
ncbi:DUF2971 domain-containing protein [Aeromonas enteropelogenes]|uniref:DUF2971 domain-containing protein n=1 Tax=Aeromonas enteropelogenes TaxID=29489 RepID=UPI0009E57D4C|nr:DUF2971 domain-containing protein [Aeromonas enteropelogenes]UBH57108.1 DUF2971 domain-containing protein [Aeromonas enteropelogenes]